MKKIKDNKGVIIFYLLVIVSGLILKLNNDREVTLNEEHNNMIAYNELSD